MRASCLAETRRSLRGRVTGRYGDRPLRWKNPVYRRGGSPHPPGKTVVASIRYTQPNKAAGAIPAPSGARDHQLVRYAG